jgi:hypothetical protein
MASFQADHDAAAFTSLLTERELSQCINRSIRTLQADRLRGGGIPYIKIGHLVRCDWDAVVC